MHASSTTDEGYTSQRGAFRQRRRAAAEAVAGSGAAAAVDSAVAGSLFTPLPLSSGFYDGIDADAREAPRPSPEARRQQLRESLEAQAVSTVEFTDGGEDDIEMNGLPPERFHGQAGWTTIPKDSALYNSLYGVGDLESRQRINSWGVARRHGVVGGQGAVADLLGESGAACAAAAAAAVSSAGGAAREAGAAATATLDVLDDRRRRRQHDSSLLSTSLEGEMLAPMQESVGQPRSTYAMRKMYVDGLVGYQGMITRAEEAKVSEELLRLLQSARAAYVAEEARYCVNLYERELGIPGKDTLAFALSSCPALQQVLYRFFLLGLIPSPPNVCQVSEMVGTFSGYPVHRHPPSIGAYVGLLNLVSTSVLHLQHKDAPWFPRLHLAPRSLFVVTEPCLGDYAMGYKQTHQPFYAFEYATRVSRDYRIEVLFATVETAQTRTLSQAVQLTEYAERKVRERQQQPPEAPQLAGPTPPAPAEAAFRGRTDEWLERLRTALHESEADAGQTGGRAAASPLDGHALRRQLLAEHLVGERPRRDDAVGRAAFRGDPHSSSATAEADADGTGSVCSAPPAGKPSTSAAQRRMAALKARYKFAQDLKASQERVEKGSDGPRLIRGHAPRDRHMGIK